jgi:hypothetical protein
MKKTYTGFRIKWKSLKKKTDHNDYLVKVTWYYNNIKEHRGGYKSQKDIVQILEKEGVYYCIPTAKIAKWVWIRMKDFKELNKQNYDLYRPIILPE